MLSIELPFPDELDLQGEAGFQRVWDAQILMRALPTLGLPGLTVSTGLVGKSPVGVQIIAGRYREDLCLRAGEAIEARGTPPAPIDPLNERPLLQETGVECGAIWAASAKENHHGPGRFASIQEIALR